MLKISTSFYALAVFEWNINKYDILYVMMFYFVSHLGEEVLQTAKKFPEQASKQATAPWPQGSFWGADESISPWQEWKGLVSGTNQPAGTVKRESFSLYGKFSWDQLSCCIF